MKSVRRILLERHRGAVPALDEVRADVVGGLAEQNRAPAQTEDVGTESWLGTFWQELFVSCRRYWMGLGAAWCGILLVGLLGAGETVTRGGMADRSSPATLEAVQEQFQLRAELLTGAPDRDPRATPAEPAPRPRSSLGSQLIAV